MRRVQGQSWTLERFRGYCVVSTHPYWDACYNAPLHQCSIIGTIFVISFLLHILVIINIFWVFCMSTSVVLETTRDVLWFPIQMLEEIVQNCYNAKTLNCSTLKIPLFLNFANGCSLQNVHWNFKVFESSSQKSLIFLLPLVYFSAHSFPAMRTA